MVSAAKRVGISLKQTYAKEGKALRRRAGGYAHAKQFRRLKRVIKRQRTILGVVIREVQRKQALLDEGLMAPKAWSELSMWLERAERVRTQQTKDKNKLYALHAPEVECIGKGKARKPDGMRSSMSRKGNCWDNAPTESLWGSLKVGRLYGKRFATQREAMDEVIDWLTFYNHRRLHSTLGYISPMKYEENWRAGQAKKAA